ncbi:type III secretion system chaperone [Thalassoglobus sp. JC818]|uniref:type III secretion system chaperone n=1 Tax=Thalassoglobus sp. JC818 TaxID=3232136 RepID=UPI0034576B1E
MHQDQFAAQLAARLELSLLKFNDDSICRLIFDGEFVVDVEWVDTSQMLHMYSVVHSRASELEPKYVQLLKANLFGRETNGSAFSIDINRDEVLLIQSFRTTNLDMDVFIKSLELFVDTVSHWKHLLGKSEIETEYEPQESKQSEEGLIRV